MVKFVDKVFSKSLVSSDPAGVISIPRGLFMNTCDSCFCTCSGVGSTVSSCCDMYALRFSGFVKYFGGRYTGLPLKFSSWIIWCSVIVCGYATVSSRAFLVYSSVRK